MLRLAIFVCVLLNMLFVPALPFTAYWVVYVKGVSSAHSRMLQGTAVETLKSARGLGSGFNLNLRAQASPLDAECEAEGKVVCHQGHIKGQPGAPLCTPSFRHRRMATSWVPLIRACWDCAVTRPAWQAGRVVQPGRAYAKQENTVGLVGRRGHG